MQEEDLQSRGVSKDVYLEYLRSTGSLAIPPLVLLTLIAAQGANIATNLWLAWWSQQSVRIYNGHLCECLAALMPCARAWQRTAN